MTSKTMKAAVFVEPGRIELREKPFRRSALTMLWFG
jgi:hypothetical protein